jgi:hypothetical protein
MPITDMYNDFRHHFPGISKQTDIEHVNNWNHTDIESVHAWFESLAKTLNKLMLSHCAVDTITPIYAFFRKCYVLGNDDEKQCIDVAFVENLFWQMKPETAEPYWLTFPQELKDLYVNFHHRAPA